MPDKIKESRVLCADLKLSSEAVAGMQWLDTMTEPDGGVRRTLHVKSGELGNISTQITGYAAHFFAWLYCVTGEDMYRVRAAQHASWIVRLWEQNGRKFLPFEPDSDISYFFDCGMAARGLSLVARMCDSKEFARAGSQIADSMHKFRFEDQSRMFYRAICKRDWTSVTGSAWSAVSGPYQLKAALAMKLFNPLWDCDINPDVFGLDAKVEKDGDLTHPLAYFVEGLMMSATSRKRLLFWSDILRTVIQTHCERSERTGLWRSDALAQSIRIRLILKLEIGQSIEALKYFQADDGGFWFCQRNGKMGPHLSAHATMFAVQALIMADLEKIPDLGELTVV